MRTKILKEKIDISSIKDILNNKSIKLDVSDDGLRVTLCKGNTIGFHLNFADYSLMNIFLESKTNCSRIYKGDVYSLSQWLEIQKLVVNLYRKVKEECKRIQQDAHIRNTESMINELVKTL
jgi:hypothetical protein